ncbi:MAG: phosphoribosyltransferase family protein [bacterium]
MFSWLIDALFPLECVGCGAEKTIACENCLANLRFNEETTCPQVTVTGGQVAFVSMYSYANPIVKGLLRKAKFHAVEPTRGAIIQLARKGLAHFASQLPSGDDVIVIPIPVVASRLRERGFDHILDIAKVVSANLKAPIVKALAAKEHKRQSQLESEASRLKNIREVFSVCAPVSGKRVILVDDVATSGATLGEAARVLESAGVCEVFGVVLARGGKKSESTTS